MRCIDHTPVERSQPALNALSCGHRPKEGIACQKAVFCEFLPTKRRQSRCEANSTSVTVKLHHDPCKRLVCNWLRPFCGWGEKFVWVVNLSPIASLQTVCNSLPRAFDLRFGDTLPLTPPVTSARRSRPPSLRAGCQTTPPPVRRGPTRGNGRTPWPASCPLPARRGRCPSSSPACRR